MDFSFVLEHLPYLIRGAGNTLAISAVTLVLATIVGVIGAWIKTSQFKFLRVWVTIYVEIARNTPELVQIYFVFFVLPSLGLKFSPIVCGIIAMTFFGGGYLLEVFRSGIEAVPKTQFEAASSLALSKFQVMVYIVFPQAVKICLPSLIGYYIYLLKTSSLLSAIGIMELTFATTDIISIYFHNFEMFTATAIIYLLMVWSISWILGNLERKVNYEF